MISVAKRFLILTAVFAAAVVLGLAAGRNSRQPVISRSTLAAPSLPVLYTERDGVKLGPLYGYAREMDDSVVSESLIPFRNDLTMRFYLADSDETPSEVSYEVRSEEDGRLIERGTVTEFDGLRGKVSFLISLRDLLEEGGLYAMKMTLALHDRTAFYYTHISRRNEQKLTDMLLYLQKMHTDLFDRSTALAYAAKLEPSDTADTGTLAHVDLHSSFTQFCWASSGAKQVSETWVTLRSFDGDFGHFTVRFLVEAATGGNTSAVFKVEESVSLQMFLDVTYLLYYERDLQQVWRLSADNLLSSGILVGVQGSGADAVSGDEGDLTAFTAAGELYVYQASAQTLTRVFSFGSDGEHELRTLCPLYRIRILSVENGQVDFLLTGYFSGGGEREGCCGLYYFRYDAGDHTLTERMRLDSSESAGLLMRDADRLLYETDDGLLYFSHGDRIFVLDFISGEVSVLVTEEEIDRLAVNEGGTALAWVTGAEKNELRFLDLKTGNGGRIGADPGESFEVLGYMREDLVLGIRREGDPSFRSGGGDVTPFRGLRILDEKGGVITSYAYENTYISGITIDSEKILIRRCSWRNKSFQYLEDDVMIRGDGVPPAEESLFRAYTHPTLMRMLLLPQTKLPSFLRIHTRDTEILRQTASLALPEHGRAEEKALRYYAFGSSLFPAVCRTAGEAIMKAAEKYGYVLDSTGRIIWLWKERLDRDPIVPEGGFSLPESGVLDISGTHFRQLIYFLDRKQPVCWISPDRGEYWIIGYDTDNAVLWRGGDSITIPRTTLEKFILRECNYLWVER